MSKPLICGAELKAPRGKATYLHNLQNEEQAAEIRAELDRLAEERIPRGLENPELREYAKAKIRDRMTVERLQRS